MAVPLNIRVNTSAPFPALTNSTAPVSVTKQNGIWTVGLSFTQLATQVPPPANFPNDYVLVWDNNAKIFFQVSLSTLVALAGGARTQRSITVSPVVIISTDSILNININTGTPTCSLPAASTRSGVPLTFKDVAGHFGAHPLTITPNGGDTIDGASSLVLQNNFQSTTLVPFTDGINTGWFIT